MKLEKGQKIYVAGHRGMVGSSVVRCLERGGYGPVVTATSAEVDLREQAAVREFIGREKPDVVVVAAAKVGGSHATATYPAECIYDNRMVAANLGE
ncbi:MAG: NAD-dependent epimerase/dehydratase family protein, partial [Verrucomicrobiales bacterium]|nr:NAD-dependent epimerase/dehydratase family protein [Verrucomicrobiales bacterium]